MVSEAIDPSVARVQPVHQTIDLGPYCIDGELFPTDEQTAQFVADFSRHWSLAEPRPLSYHGVPYVFTFDFSDVQSFDPNSFSEGFTFAEANCLGRLWNVYSIYDHITPWQEFGERIGHTRRAKIVVTARRQGVEQYELTGNPNKVALYQNLMADLAEAGDWVKGADFVRGRVNPPTTVILHNMRQDGLALYQWYGGRSYYRCLF